MFETQPYHAQSIQILVILSIALPLLSALVSSVIREQYAWATSFISPLLLLASAVSSMFLFSAVWDNQVYTISYSWFIVGDSEFSAGLYVNNLSVLMMAVVNIISFLVHLYSTGYMAGDSGIKRYFIMLGFFTFAMHGILASNNLLLVFVFWELVGFSSYMLIGHWYTREFAAAAAKKAFIFNRIGDVGFLIGLMIIWANTNTFDLLQLAESQPSFTGQTAAGLFLFCGVIGKSAQFPLLTWLPDAMEGPTPVSALIHAATMVAAGVFLLARIDFIFTDVSLNTVAIIGMATSIMAALLALVQTDIKKVLAYSTISQLGLMISVIGAGSAAAGVLHLFTHAFFKAGLFLAAGSIIHVLHQAQHQAHTEFDVQDLRNIGGLRKKLPLTFVVFILCGASLAGLPFFSGFLSKDAMLTVFSMWKGETFTWRWFIYAGAFITSFLTVLYTFRLIWFLFAGNEKKTEEMRVIEAPAMMKIPMIILAACSLWFMVSVTPFDYMGWFFARYNSQAIAHVDFMAGFSVLWVALAVVTAYFVFNKRTFLSTPPFYESFYLDKVYNAIVVIPIQYLAKITTKGDSVVIDGFIHSFTYVYVTTAHVVGWVDRAIVDGVVNGFTAFVRSVGSFTRSFQGGKIQLYVFWSVFTVIIFLIWALF